jgi:LacI family transcriptional regulator
VLTQGRGDVTVTIRDVAHAAGVSISTVSRALSSPEQVAAGTRVRVQDAARSMGYRPNHAARGLITKRTGSIGLVVPDLENPFFGSICKGVQARARSAGYAVFIGDTDEDPTIEADVVRSLVKQVDGLILCSARCTDNALERLAQNCRLVLINRRLGDILSITFDEGGGVRALMRHLVALGHRRIASAAGPEITWSDRERCLAFRTFAAESPELDLIELGNFPPFFSGGVQAGDLAIASGATAIVAFNDLVAVGLLDRLCQRGVRVPHDISVTGFDNVPVSRLVSPSLTTVNSPRVQMGRASVDLLLSSGPGGWGDLQPVREMPVELIVRESTGVTAIERAPAGIAGSQSVEPPFDP